MYPKGKFKGEDKKHIRKGQITWTGMFISTGTDIFLKVTFPIIVPPGNIPTS